MHSNGRHHIEVNQRNYKRLAKKFGNSKREIEKGIIKEFLDRKAEPCRKDHEE